MAPSSLMDTIMFMTSVRASSIQKPVLRPPQKPAITSLYDGTFRRIETKGSKIMSSIHLMKRRHIIMNIVKTIALATTMKGTDTITIAITITITIRASILMIMDMIIIITGIMWPII